MLDYQCQNCDINSGLTNAMQGCRRNMNKICGTEPTYIYQNNQIIKGKVRMMSSLYTFNLGALSGYKIPSAEPQTIYQNGSPYIVPANSYWNQMSDRPSQSIQNVKTASGSAYRSSSTRHSIMRHRPGSMSPGGVGVDIKHNSYERYLNKIKGGKLRNTKNIN